MKKILMSIVCLGLLIGCQQTSSVTAKNGDIVIVDFVGKKNGVAFDGGTAKNYPLELGSHAFIDGFEEGIVGMKLGSEKTIDVTFPSTYQESSLAGQDCTFDITLNKVYSETQDKAIKGDYVKIDYVGKLDGQAFDGGTASGYLLGLGSGTFIDGFEDQLIGMKAAETKTIKVTFPSNYGTTTINGKEVSLANEEVTFDVAVNHIYREVK